jgi:alkylated DNA nucleotide flippase Atl1
MDLVNQLAKIAGKYRLAREVAEEIKENTLDEFFDWVRSLEEGRYEAMTASIYARYLKEDRFLEKQETLVAIAQEIYRVAIRHFILHLMVHKKMQTPEQMVYYDYLIAQATAAMKACDRVAMYEEAYKLFLKHTTHRP